MEFRKLNAMDFAPIAGIVGKIGISEFGEIFGSENLKAVSAGGEDAEVIGAKVTFQALGIVCRNYHLVQTDVVRLLASVTGRTQADIMGLPMAEFYSMMMEFFKQEDVKDFFGQVLKSLNMAK